MSVQYVGDVNIEYGGMFIDTSDVEHGYAEVLRVTDLDSACGAEGLVMIERLTVILDNKDINVKALDSCGMLGESVGWLGLIESVVFYGYYDCVEDFTGPHRWIVVTSDYTGNKQSWDGWKPDRDMTVRLHKRFNGDLRALVESLQ